MTEDELAAREAVRHTLAAYNHAGDDDVPEAYAATFTKDGVFEGPGFRHEGRAAILAWKRGHSIFSGTSFRLHHVSSILIEMTGLGEARARSNWLVTTDRGVDHCGRYIDRFVPEGRNWLIAHREVRILWCAPESVLGERI